MKGEADSRDFDQVLYVVCDLENLQPLYDLFSKNPDKAGKQVWNGVDAPFSARGNRLIVNPHLFPGEITINYYS